MFVLPRPTLGARLFLGRKFERVAGIDVFKTETIVCHAQGLASLRAFFMKPFNLFTVH
jgi:hypothetical protein